MKNETRIEVIILVAGVMAVGGWFGFRALGKSKAPAGGRARAVVPNVMTAARAAPAVAPAPPVRPATRPRVVPAGMGPVEEPLRPVTTTTLPKAFAALPPEEAAPAPAVNDGLARAQQLIADGKLFEARALLTPLILAAGENAEREELRQALVRINETLFFSRQPSPDCRVVTVGRGDTLSAIAKREGRDEYFTHVIMLINGIKDPRRIREGQRLKTPQGTFSVRVQKRAHRLIVLLNDQYIKEYPVTLGAAASPTPVGSFEIDNNKQMKPDWYSPDGAIYKYGDAKNILGTRWIGFKETDLYAGYGIHGTNDPLSIGQNASNGCVRMRNLDVEELFGMLMPGEKVEIVP